MLKTLLFLPGSLTEYKIGVILFPDRGDCMERLIIPVIVFLAIYILVCIDCYRYRKKLKKQDKKLQRLENELKL